MTTASRIHQRSLWRVVPAHASAPFCNPLALQSLASGNRASKEQCEWALFGRSGANNKKRTQKTQMPISYVQRYRS